MKFSPKIQQIATPIFGLLMAGLTLWTFLSPDSLRFQRPELARIFYWHFPCSIWATLFMLAGGFFAIRSLVKGDKSDDARSVACNEITFLFCILTMLTGIIFSKAQWGAWWQNDPRQTSFLLVLMIYAGYFALRAAYASDQDRRTTISSAYSVAAILPVLFLIFVYPRLPQVQSFHPADTIVGRKLDTNYQTIISLMLIAFGFVAVTLYRSRMRVSALELKVANYDGNLENTRSTASAPRVVRSVHLSDENQSESQKS